MLRRYCCFRHFAALSIALYFSTPALAVQTYCVGTPAEFQDALDQAELDDDDSRIDVRAGTYNLGSDLAYHPTLEHIVLPGSLTIDGGYGPGCASQNHDAAVTTLHGDGSRELYAFVETGSVTIKSLDFDGVSLNIGDSALADDCSANGLAFDLRRLSVNNGHVQVFGALCHDVKLRDSLLINGNGQDDTPAGTSLDVNLNSDDSATSHVTDLVVINTTVVNGRFNIGACCDVLPTAFLYDSIFYRSGTEIYSSAVNVLAFNDRFDPISFSANSPLPAGSLLAASASNTAANPDLDANYRPNPDSPMVDSGTSTVPDGLSSIDLHGGPRVVGANVDRGAIESTIDGSGVYTVTNTNASGAGSLADAIALANADAGFNTIEFNIPGNCPRHIVLAATLPIRGSLFVDGWSQPGSVQNDDDLYWNAVPCVILDGSGTLGTGILTDPQLDDGNLRVRGVAFEGFSAAMLLTFGRNHLIHGNQFGGQVGAAGPTLSNNEIAIAIAGAVSGSIIGGSDAAQRNLIGASSDTGVQIIGASATANQIVNNLIGVDKNVVGDLPNRDGVYISSSGNRIVGNRISRNTRDGVVLSGSNAHDNTISDNLLGGTISSAPFSLSGNERMGVLVDNAAHDNTIGPDNVIARNGDSGVRVLAAAGGHNTIIANRIDRNGAPGIDLGANGVSANDLDPQLCDIDNGCSANRGQNFPVIESALRLSPGDLVGLSIAAHLSTTYSASPYRIDFYRSPNCSASGHGEGAHWIGSKSVVVALSGICASGNCTADFSFATLDDHGVQVGDAISATATSPAGDTSEFAACVLVVQAVSDRIFADDFE